jgi:hypothetical protein
MTSWFSLLLIYETDVAARHGDLVLPSTNTPTQFTDVIGLNHALKHKVSESGF